MQLFSVLLLAGLRVVGLPIMQYIHLLKALKCKTLGGIRRCRLWMHCQGAKMHVALLAEPKTPLVASRVERGKQRDTFTLPGIQGPLLGNGLAPLLTHAHHRHKFTVLLRCMSATSRVHHMIIDTIHYVMILHRGT